MQIMTKNHKRWREFCHRLAWELETGKDETESLRKEILTDMGFTDVEIIASLDYLKKHDAHLLVSDLEGLNWKLYGDVDESEVNYENL